MTKNPNELRVEVDVDDTLVIHGVSFGIPGFRYVDLNYYGMPKRLAIHTEHVELLHSYKARGFHITVHSANGVGWCEEVVSKLGLEPVVDHIQSKTLKVLDDKSPGDATGQRVYIPFNSPTRSIS